MVQTGPRVPPTSERILVLDVRNHATTIGVMEGTEHLASFRVRTSDHTTDELGVLMLAMLQHRGVEPRSLRGAIACSVVPSTLYAFEKALRRYLDLELKIVGRGLKTGLRIQIDNPRELGADRVVHAVGGLDLIGGPVVVVGLGDATTVDCVTRDGAYVGGAIAPGFNTAAESLANASEQLPRVELVRPRSVIGRSTVTSMQSGLFWGYIGLLDGLAGRCRDALDPNARVVATGAMAHLLGEASEVVDRVEPALSLHGLALLYQRNL